MSPRGKSASQAEPVSATPETRSANEAADSIVEHVRWAVSTWPQIDPDVEGIVSRVDKIDRYLKNAFRSSLGQAGLTKEEWKVIMAVSREVRSHGWLCRDLGVSTGAVTNVVVTLADVRLL